MQGGAQSCDYMLTSLVALKFIVAKDTGHEIDCLSHSVHSSLTLTHSSVPGDFPSVLA
jgi:hypothetical protein